MKRVKAKVMSVSVNVNTCFPQSGLFITALEPFLETLSPRVTERADTT